LFWIPTVTMYKLKCNKPSWECVKQIKAILSRELQDYNIWGLKESFLNPHFRDYFHSIICHMGPHCQNSVGIFAKIHSIAILKLFVLRFGTSCVFLLVKQRALNSLCLFCILLEIFGEFMRISWLLVNFCTHCTNPKYIQTKLWRCR